MLTYMRMLRLLCSVVDALKYATQSCEAESSEIRCPAVPRNMFFVVTIDLSLKVAARLTVCKIGSL